MVTGSFVYLITSDEHVLLVYSTKGWTLPGGHMDKGEDARSGALREFHEETGMLLSNLSNDPVLISKSRAYFVKRTSITARQLDALLQRFFQLRSSSNEILDYILTPIRNLLFISNMRPHVRLASHLLLEDI